MPDRIFRCLIPIWWRDNCGVDHLTWDEAEAHSLELNARCEILDNRLPRFVPSFWTYLVKESGLE